MALTQADLANQMIQQLRVLDPSVSAAIGTPERKIIDTVAQALADAQIDLTVLSGALDLDSKYGSNLDKFLALFGFARQTSTAATGVVTFSRTVASNNDIRIPVGTQITTNANVPSPMTFLTTVDVVMPAGETSIDAPIQAAVGGVAGNVAANSITVFVGSPTLGVTAVTNGAPTTGGADQETDDALKLRFKNTVFRNVSGTEDQYLALAVATAFTSKANVVGPISRYREYVQVPLTDDATNSGGGNADEWTTALSTIPYSKHVYDTLPIFVSNGATGSLAEFYIQGLDFVVNILAADKNRGDTHRLATAGTGPDPEQTPFQPNVTFFNVMSADADPSIQGIREGDIVLFEHSYMSSESRNDFENNVTNCVDVFIDGGNVTQASIVVPTPRVGSDVFSSNPVGKLYTENFRRIGQPEHRPVPGNYFTRLLFQPVLDLPPFIQVNGVFYYNGIHYWPVEEVSSLGGTVRSRNGIEWAATVPGQITGDPEEGPFTGDLITANTAPATTIDGYSFDKNILDLQSAYEGAKQVTTDVLAHKSRTRYFKLDVTVMYSPGTTPAVVNAAVQSALSTFLAGQYFGTTIQLSDLLQVIHNVTGIDNVRWTRDVDTTKNRVTECDVNGNPLIDGVVDRLVAGSGSTPEVQTFYFPNPPSTLTETFTIQVGDNVTAPIAFNASTSTINTALGAASIAATVTDGAGTAADPYVLTFSANGWVDDVAQVAADFTTTTKSLNNDFYLRDNELPALPSLAPIGDTLPGITLRPRAQNTWQSA